MKLPHDGSCRDPLTLQLSLLPCSYTTSSLRFRSMITNIYHVQKKEDKNMIVRLYFYSYLMVALFFSMSSFLFAQAQAPAPVFKDGDTWQLKFEPHGQLRTS